MKDENVIDELISSGAFVRGRFRLAAGGTTDLKFEIEHVEAHPGVLASMAYRLAASLQYPQRIEAVVGVDSGGIKLARLVGRSLESICKRPQESMLVCDSHKVTRGGFTMTRGDIARLQNRERMPGPVSGGILIVEDVVTTGLSVRSVRHTLEIYRVPVYSVVSIVARGEITAQDLGVHEYACALRTDFEMTSVRQRLALA